MALGINTNVASLNAQNQLSKSQGQNDQALERLSSGLRINSAKDDAAGLAISSRFEAQINGLNQASRNANDAISLAQTAEGALEELGNISQRIRELAVQSANDTNSQSDRAALNEEVGQLIEEADRIAQTTQFNNQDILNGALSELSFQVGANAGQTIEVSGVDASANALGRTVLGSETDFGSAISTDLEAFTDGDDVSINGQDFTFQSDGSGDFSNVSELREAINSADFGNEVGVTASQISETRVDLGEFSQGNDGTNGEEVGNITINGVSVDLSADDGSSVNLSTAINRINDRSLATGVEAVENDAGDGFELVQSAGNDVTVNVEEDAQFDDVAAADAGGDLVFEAGLELSIQGGREDDLNVSGNLIGSDNLGLDGDPTGRTLDNLSVDTRPNADQAIETIDGVLDQINGIRSELGAVQNRFESTINNLNTTSENLSASNSRIVDADFAAESANLSQSQVLQQAGISVLAQANARPQQVLSLLQ